MRRGGAESKAGDLNPNTPVATWILNGQNSPIERQRVSEHIHRQDSSRCCQKQVHLRYKRTDILRIKGSEEIYLARPIRSLSEERPWDVAKDVTFASFTKLRDHVDQWLGPLPGFRKRPDGEGPAFPPPSPDARRGTRDSGHSSPRSGPSSGTGGTRFRAGET